MARFTSKYQLLSAYFVIYVISVLKNADILLFDGMWQSWWYIVSHCIGGKHHNFALQVFMPNPFAKALVLQKHMYVVWINGICVMWSQSASLQNARCLFAQEGISTAVTRICIWSKEVSGWRVTNCANFPDVILMRMTRSWTTTPLVRCVLCLDRVMLCYPMSSVYSLYLSAQHILTSCYINHAFPASICHMHRWNHTSFHGVQRPVYIPNCFHISCFGHHDWSLV